MCEYTYEDAIVDIEMSEDGCGTSSLANDDYFKNYHNGVIGQIAIANAIKGLAEEYKRRTDLMEGFYSVMVKVADSLEGVERNIDGLGNTIFNKY